MVNQLSDLLRDAAEARSDDDTDLSEVIRAGRRQVRRRRLAAAGTALAVTGVVGLGGVLAGVGASGDGSDRVANTTAPRPEGPVLSLRAASPAVAGEDYELLASYTNRDLNSGNGQYYEGVTDDGMILFKDGPHGLENTVRYALLDPATGAKQWLPDLDLADQLWPIHLGADRLVLASLADDDGDSGSLRALVLDRSTGDWTTMAWPGLAAVDTPSGTVGPDGRLYVRVPATRGTPPGGWPVGVDGEAEDAGADGESYDLWSVSLTDAADVRDERLRLGSFAFTDDALVWSASTGGTNDRIHVRDLATGAEHDFDPRSGERCNLLGFGAGGDRIVLSQYCGTYDDGRDDRVQVLSTDGEPVTTIQGDGISGWIGDDSGGKGHLLQISSYLPAEEGHYVYDLDTDRLVRVTESVSSWSLGGPAPAGYLTWDTAYGQAVDPGELDAGATQSLVRWG